MRKIIWLGSILLAACFAQAGVTEDYRTFTSADGRTMRARIAEYNRTKNELKIEKPGGGTAWVSPGIFAECDRSYIREWIEADRILSPQSLKLSLEEKSITGSKGEKIIHYEVSVRNRSGADFDNVRIEYRFFLELTSARYDVTRPKRLVSGVLKTGSLADGREKTVRTGNAIDFEQLTSTHKTTYTDANGIARQSTTGGDSLGRCEVKGIWIRIQGPDVDGKPTYRDVCDPENLSSIVDWDDDERVPMEENFSFFDASKPDKDILSLEEVKKRGKAGSKQEYWEWMKLVYEQFRQDLSPAEMRQLEAGVRFFYNSDYDERGGDAAAIASHCKRYGLLTEAAYWYEIALKKTDDEDLSGIRMSLARIYSCAQDAKLRNGPKAVEYAAFAFEKDKKNERMMDLMARAYAANGQFDLAVKMQKQAVERYKRQRHAKDDNPTYIAYKKRLELYQNGKPYIETDMMHM